MSGLQKAVHIFVCTLREIFDEAAYNRFLHRTQMPPSKAAYAAFWREREAACARKIRCC